MVMAASEQGKRALSLLQGSSLSRALDAFPTTSHLKQVHAHLIVAGRLVRPLTAARLLACAAVSHLRDLRYAEAMFQHIESPTLFMYNTIFRAFSQCPGQDHLQGVAYYVRMLRAGVLPDKFTFPFLVRSCSLSSQLVLGRQVHGHVVRFGLEGDVYVVNNLICMYATCGGMADARQVFEKSSGLVDVVSWTSLVTGFAKAGNIDQALFYFDRMPCKNVVSWNAMISAYGNCGRIGEARKIFDEMPERDVSSWSAMMSGYNQCKMWADALGLFKEMVGSGILPNEAAVVTAVSVCAQLRSYEEGHWLEEYLKENKFEMKVILGTALIDMHGKCGNIEKAIQVFNSMPDRNVYTWNTTIASLALNGYGKQALSLFWKMQLVGPPPNAVTFIALLSGCSHSGLIKEGRHVFNIMTEKYQIEPQLEHYGCMVDLLGRAGLIREAAQFVESMNSKPHPGLWGALVGGCKIHGENEIGELLGKHLIDLEPGHCGRYALLSDIYASSEHWDAVEMVRNSFKENKLPKTPGSSIVEL